jgi:hypothetical protein
MLEPVDDNSSNSDFHLWPAAVTGFSECGPGHQNPKSLLPISKLHGSYEMYEAGWVTSAIFARYRVRSFDSFSAQAASVDSFLQNVKRTWRAPMAGSS